jgi:transposase InsO family protein
LSANGDKKQKKNEPLESVMGRPKTGTLSSFSPLIRQDVENYRPGDGGWSAKTIAIELSLDPRFKEEPKPSISSINDYLSKRGKSKRKDKHSSLPTSPVIEATRPHQAWQMDSEGTKQVQGLGWVAPINVKDVAHKIYVMTYPCVLKTASNHPTRADYQRTLRLAFMEWGLPEHLQTDHESVFFDNKTKSPYPTQLHLWLIGLNIELHFTPFRKPQKQGMVEKAHQTMHRQITDGRSFDTPIAIFEFAQQRRQRLNEHIPSTVTQNLPPLIAHPDASFSGRLYEPLEEEQIFDIVLIQNYLANGKWFRRIAPNNTISLGGYIYHLPKGEPSKDVEIRYNREQDTFDCFDADGILIGYQKAKGLSFKELSGDFLDFLKWIQLVTLPKH